MRWIGRAGAGLLTALLLLALAVWFVVATETGLRWAWPWLRGYLPPAVTVEAVEGRLIGPLAVHGLRVETAGARVGVDRMALRWQPGALWSGRVSIDRLALDGLDVTLKPGPESEPDEAPFRPPESIDLPVAVELRELLLTDATVRTAPDAEPVAIERLRAAVSLTAEEWSIRELAASGPRFQLAGDARLAPRRPYPLDLALDWTLRLPDLAPIPGRTTVTGDLSRLAVEQTLGAPYNAEAQVALIDPLDALRIDAELRLRNTALAAIAPDLPPAELSAQLAAEGSLDDLSFEGGAGLAAEQYGRADLDLAGRFTGDAVRLDRVVLTSPDAAGRLTAAGSVALAPGAPMDLMIRWRDLQWPLQAETGPAVASPSGEVALEGTLEAYRLRAALDWRVPDRGDGRLRLAGTGDRQSLALETLSVTGAPGTLSGTARLAWAPAFQANLRLTGDGVNPGAVIAGWPGDLAVELAADLRADDAGLHVDLRRLHADGRLRDRPMRLTAAAQYQPGILTVDNLELQSGDATLAARGRAGLGPGMADTDWNLSWQIQAPDLAALVPGAAGSLHGAGTVRGTIDAPRLRGELEGESLRYGDVHIGGLALAADLDATGAQQSSLDLRLQQASAGQLQLRELHLAGSGTPGEHRLTLTAADLQRVDLALSAAGRLADDAWLFSLDRADIDYPDVPPLELAAPASGRFGLQRQRLETGCWHARSARLCLAGERSRDEVVAEASLDELPLAWLRPWLPPDITVEGTVSGRGDLDWTGDVPRARVNVTTTAGGLVARDPEEGAIPLLAFEPGRLDLALDADGLRLDGELPLADADGHVRVQTRVDAPPDELLQGPLSGRIGIMVRELDVLAEMVPEVERVEGRLAGEFALSGRLGQPRVEGELVLSAQRLALVTPGIEMTDVRLALSGRGDTIAIEGGAESGGGRLSAEGWLAFQETDPVIELALRGRDFRIMDTRDARVHVSPDLNVRVDAEQVRVTGGIVVPSAEITPRNLPGEDVVTVSEDQVIVRPDGETDGRDRAVFANVRVTLGDAVYFEGFGLTADFAGALTIVERPQEPVTGSGELRITEGRYRAYGQDLDIRTGRLLFAGGPIGQPGLDVEAVRRPAQGVLVGVRVRGNLRAPDFALFSEPPMGQSEQLSWLILGRPLNDTTAAESGLVNRAALALGLRGGNFLAENLGERLGLDEVGIETAPGAAAEEAALVVGKYLSPRLYVSYGIGLFEPVSTVRLRYTLSPMWRIETQSSGPHAGGDIIFSIERGQ